jgi:pectate lyase
VLCDNFEDGNITQNPAWIATPAAFTGVADGSQVLNQKATSEAWAYAGNVSWTDVTISARVKVIDFAGTSTSNCGGLVARFQGSSNPNYQASLCAKGSVGIYKDGGLVDETNGTKNLSLVANTWYALKFSVSGAPGQVKLTLSVDGTEAINITDTDTSASVASGYIGLGSKKTLNIEFDDIQVSTP